MTKKTRLIIAVALLVLVGLFSRPASSQPTDGIIVSYADAVREESVAGSQDLSELLSETEPRIIAQYLDSLRETNLSAVSSNFNDKLQQVKDRLILQYADWSREMDIHPIPAGLGPLLDGVDDRTVIQYADFNRDIPLGYPVGLFQDESAPIISNIHYSVVGVSTARVTWTTDEIANSTVEYGGETGIYTNSVSSELYVKQHEIILTSLNTENATYFRIKSSDRNGNLAESGEYTLAGVYPLFLPMTLK